MTSCKNVILKKGDGTATFRDYQHLIILQDQRKLCLVTSNVSSFPKITQNFQGKKQGKSAQPKTQPLCTTHTFAFLSNHSQAERMSTTSLQTKHWFHFTADNSFRGKKKKKKGSIPQCTLKTFFPQKRFQFLMRERLSSVSILLVWIKKNILLFFILLPTSTS